ncbi:hypothetical protein E2C01_026288 [Portunus trituberculatus]|uniref:Uncharacterized protein n=1 Tax=Portunus trituberculatus TaxID=210409 RepID=A0A5B7EFL5_PORTR|nr:hypothetical protein [Portunus trituberculatus]
MEVSRIAATAPLQVTRNFTRGIKTRGTDCLTVSLSQVTTLGGKFFAETRDKTTTTLHDHEEALNRTKAKVLLDRLLFAKVNESDVTISVYIPGCTGLGRRSFLLPRLAPSVPPPLPRSYLASALPQPCRSLTTPSYTMFLPQPHPVPELQPIFTFHTL